MCRAALIPGARLKISRLARHGDDTATTLASAVHDSLAGKASTAETSWIRRIEALRTNLDSSTATVTMRDYGAGSPTLHLSAEDVERGRTITKTIGYLSRHASKPRFWATLLFRLVRAFGPSMCLELGTNIGISAAYQAAALKLNGHGRIITLEGADSLAALAQEHFRKLNLDNVELVLGRFQDTLDGVLEANPPVDYAFIDGHHSEDATVEYFYAIARSANPPAVIVLDDINWSDGMKNAWSTVQSDERVSIAIDLSLMGICVIGSAMAPRTTLTISMV